MDDVAWILGLLTAVTLVAVLARRTSIPYPTLMVLSGVAIGLVPELPAIKLNPDVVLVVFLPPLLSAASWGLPWTEFQANLRPITQLAVGLTLATTFAVAAIAHTLIPGLPWPSAFVLGALVSPPDAVAATSIMRLVRVPRRIVVILEGESLVNDATALVAYRLAIAAAVTGLFSWSEAVGHFVWVVVGGCAIGLMVARIAAAVHRRLDDGNIETAITLLTPFAAYILTEMAHCSGVLSIVCCGIYLRGQSQLIFSPSIRLQVRAVWDVVVFLLTGLAFVLIGLQLRTITSGITNESPAQIAWWAFLIILTTVAVRMVWVFPAAYLPRTFIRGLRDRDPSPSWKMLVLLGWTGMRGVVSLAAALALPEKTMSGEPFPSRNLIIFLTFCVILGTLLSQSLTLPGLVRLLKLETPRSPLFEETDARLDILTAANRYLDQTGIHDADCGSEVEYVRRHFEIEASHALARITEEHPEIHDPLIARHTLHEGALQAQRERLARLRSERQFDNEILNRLERELDIAETHLQSNAYRAGKNSRPQS